MRLEIEWSEPARLRRAGGGGFIYTVESDQLQARPGVYVFARRWRSSFEALYVGQAKNVRRRVHRQLNNLKLMRYVEDAKSGPRVVLAGYAVTRPGQRLDRVLRTAERAVIRHFLSEGHDLVNQQGTKIREHEVASRGAPKGFLPQRMYVERPRRK